MRVLLIALLLTLVETAEAARCSWPAWEQAKRHLLSEEGRIIDASSPRQITTSEGQSYGLFFALAADDRATFAHLLQWTENNLAEGDLTQRLPAWLWGRADDGRWQVLDRNNASDSDLWIAYSLLEAGRLWQREDYRRLGLDLLWRSAAQTVRVLPGLGLMLLPGDIDFESAQGWRLNPSYLPPQLLARFALEGSIWAELEANTRRLLRLSAPQGLVPDWLLWQRTGQPAADPEYGHEGDYDAIRVYLWLGMLAAEAPERQALLSQLAPMARLTAERGAPPERIDAATGQAQGLGPAGFSAALLPLLAAQAPAALRVQRARLAATPAAPTAYYEQMLRLFGEGWDRGLFRFDAAGRLQPAWQEGVCPD